MAPVSERTYRFELAAQWEAGIRRDLELRGDRLVVPDQLAVEPIAGAGVTEAGALPAADACGHLMWLRPRSRELVRRPPAGSRGPIELGTLDGPPAARRMLAGRSLVWVLAGGDLDRYDAGTLQRLGPVRTPDDRRISDVTGDGGDGLWLTEVDPAGRWQVRHVDCWGRSCRPPVAVPGPGVGELAIASTGDGSRLVVVDPVGSASAHVVDVATGDVRGIGLEDLHRDRSTQLAAGPGHRFHLLTRLPGAGCGVRAVYQALAMDGDVEDHQELELPDRLGRPTALVSGPAGLALACSGGVADLKRRQGVSGPRRSTFITPALTSPLGPRSGWKRAELDVVLPPGTAVEVTWAATGNAGLISQAAQLCAGPATSHQVDQLEELLPWRDEATVTYPSTGDAGPETLAAPLDGVAETTVWLRIRLHVPPGRTPPSLAGLRVRYPDASYLDHLPAIYRESESAARELRRILAPYEVLFDGLDATVAALPDRSDPAMACDDWTAYLLSWLGFPPLGDLPARQRRALLEQAARLLDLRGTRQGLQLLLDLVTDGHATVVDSAEAPVGWFLGPREAPSAAASPARLGHDTMALAQRPEPSRPGGMVVGRTPLGRGCPDPGLVLGHRAASVTVLVELDREQQERLEPIVDRLLPVFVPAHCRLQVVFTGADVGDRSRQLDVDFRLGPDDPGTDQERSSSDGLLHSDAHWRLGATTWLGGWALPERALRALVLDHGAPLGVEQPLH